MKFGALFSEACGTKNKFMKCHAVISILLYFSNFFELVRFDFVIDDTGNLWLMEVRQLVLIR